MLLHYESLGHALREAYPEYNWKSALFLEPNKRMHNGYWLDANHLIAALDDAAEKLNISQVL